MDRKQKELVETALNALERLLNMFRIERFVYLMLTALSFLILIYAGYLMITKENGNTEILVAVFGSTGLITASSARISYFFNRAFALIETLIKGLSK